MTSTSARLLNAAISGRDDALSEAKLVDEFLRAANLGDVSTFHSLLAAYHEAIQHLPSIENLTEDEAVRWDRFNGVIYSALSEVKKNVRAAEWLQHYTAADEVIEKAGRKPSLLFRVRAKQSKSKYELK